MALLESCEDRGRAPLQSVEQEFQLKSYSQSAESAVDNWADESIRQYLPLDLWLKLDLVELVGIYRGSGWELVAVDKGRSPVGPGGWNRFSVNNNHISRHLSRPTTSRLKNNVATSEGVNTVCNEF